jgi:hypothetical protein
MASGVIGYFASIMVLMTFATKDMRRLRLLGIMSNLAFISYGALCWLPPVLCLHLVLLPVNVVRLMELHKSKVGVTVLSSETTCEQPQFKA